ncbi:MAG: hypothetical protein QM784_17545 [Polyangiaceae bacterium]
MSVFRLNAFICAVSLVAVGIQVSCRHAEPSRVGTSAAAPRVKSELGSANATNGVAMSASKAAPLGSADANALTTSAATPTQPLDRARFPGRELHLEFHLVAELPYEIELLPLGATALLAGGPERLPLPLVIEGNQLKHLPELARFDERPEAGRRISVVTGTWPNQIWLALSDASDAGPSYWDLVCMGTEPRLDEETRILPVGVRHRALARRSRAFEQV